MRCFHSILLASLISLTSVTVAAPPRILFLGDQGHHRPSDRFEQLQPVFEQREIELVYTEDLANITEETLEKFDGLMIYANIDELPQAQEAAILDFVEKKGKGLIPVHCASFCFRNSKAYVEMVGAQFQSHGTGIFRTVPTAAKHPILDGFQGFESWDETYVHRFHNEKDRTVLEYRVDENEREPWTWVRTQGKGRVFYTAWGHDERTWGNAGFQNLIERGTRWAIGGEVSIVPPFIDRPKMTELRKDVAPFEYVEANVPFYPESDRWGVLGEPIRRMQKPLSAEESIKHFVTPVGFHVELFASDPDIYKPICMNWDERGRLWIAETVDYPNELKPRGEGRDRIRILEDLDGDGKADKYTTFAEKLSIPTSILPVRGGVIVVQAPDTLFLRDTDHDDVADERQVLFTGWSTGDTHAGPSNLRYGFDNWVYGMVGYAGFEGVVGGEQHSFRTGFFRFKPDGSQLEFLRNTNNNSWGVGFSEEGILFGSTANGNPSVYLPIPNRYYESVRGWSSEVLGTIAESSRFDPITKKIRQVDHHGRFTAAAGHALYTARSYPREYWNRAAFVNGPTGHLTATFILQPEGTNYRSKNSWNLLASDDEWSAPIMAEVGPDGQVWVIDWYNFIIQHNPTPAGFKTGKGNAYETELRDKTHGRIYRVVHEGHKPKPFSLKEATTEQLVAALKHDNLFWRLQAQRLLVERGEKEVVPQLQQMAADPSVDAVGINPGVIHSLWTLHGLGVVGETAKPALEHRSAAVRRTAVQVLPRNEQGIQELISHALIEDKDPQVRLATALAFSEMPVSRDVAQAIARQTANSRMMRDRWMREALISAAARHVPHTLGALVRVEQPAEGAIPLLSIVAEHWARGGHLEEISLVLELLADGNPATAGVVIAAIAKGWPAEKVPTFDKQGEELLANVFEFLHPGDRPQMVLLGQRWKSTALERYLVEIRDSLKQRATLEAVPVPERISSLKQLVDFSKADPELASFILETITPRTDPELVAGFLEALGESEAKETGLAILATLKGLTPKSRQVGIRLVLRKPEWTRFLIKEIEEDRIKLSELALDQRQSLINHPDQEIAEAAKTLLKKGGGLPDPDRQKVIDSLLEVAKNKGTPQQGKLIFEKHCSKCHKFQGKGESIGPDLTGMSVHPKEELLTQVLDPSRSVEGNFRLYSIEDKNGNITTGLLLSETKTSIEVVDTEAKKHTLLREDIEEMVASNKSVMPEGFEKLVTKSELTDLLEYLTQKGKYVPLPLDKVATVVTTKGMFYSEEGDVERMIFPDWDPKQVNGVPFVLTDPNGDKKPNGILLYGPQGNIPPKMPKSVELTCKSPVAALHLLSGVSGWGHPLGEKGSVSMIVRFHYADGTTDDVELKNGEHFADYIRRIDVPGSKFAFALRGQQIRYLTVKPARTEGIEKIEFVKGKDDTAPIIMAATIELPGSENESENAPEEK